MHVGAWTVQVFINVQVLILSCRIISSIWATLMASMLKTVFLWNKQDVSTDLSTTLKIKCKCRYFWIFFWHKWGHFEMMDTKCLRRFSFVSHKFPSQSGSYKLQSRPGEKKNNLFAKCNFLHDWWLQFLSLGAWKFSIKLSKSKAEVIYGNWNAACHNAMASSVPLVTVICAEMEKIKRTKTEVHPNFCDHYFRTSPEMMATNKSLRGRLCFTLQKDF